MSAKNYQEYYKDVNLENTEETLTALQKVMNDTELTSKQKMFIFGLILNMNKELYLDKQKRRNNKLAEEIKQFQKAAKKNKFNNKKPQKKSQKKPQGKKPYTPPVSSDSSLYFMQYPNIAKQCGTVSQKKKVVVIKKKSNK